MSIDATKAKFEHVELFGKTALFTNARVDISTLPINFYRYNLRGSDYDPGRPISVELNVGVNHAGTILSPNPIKLPDSGYKRLRGGLNFLDEVMSVKEFCKFHALEYKQRFVIRPASNDEAGTFYAQTPELDQQMGAIGHVRIDFGSGGKEFWHTWHPRGDESLNTPEFKSELATVVDQLRDSVLKDLKGMSYFCYEHKGEIDGGWRQNYGYIIETENYRYCLRCSPGKGDYHAYLSCFDMNVQRANLLKETSLSQNQQENKEKRSVRNQLADHCGQLEKKGASQQNAKKVQRNEPSL